MTSTTMTLGKLLLYHSVLLSLLCCCSAYKLLLVFPFPTKSHSILGEGYVKLLAKAGHEITYITAWPMKNPPHGVRQIYAAETREMFPVDKVFDTRSLINEEVDLQHESYICEIALVLANKTLHDNGVQKLLHDTNEEFDAVIVEWLYTEMFSGLSAVFNCPLIWSSSMEAHSMVLPLVDEYPNPAYTFHHLSRDYGYNFLQRVRELWKTLRIYLFKWNLYSQENEVYKSIYEKIVKKRGRALPSYEDVRYNGSLMLGNSYIAMGDAISLPQSFKLIGGYHIEEDRQPLPKDLQKIMDDAKHGVIYFSLGSMLRGDRIPENLKKDILDVFAALNQTVLWKLEEVLPDLPKNVHILKWASQSSILGHPNCILFITHGGILSEMEALYYGVPMIGIPMFGDQFMNVNRAVSKGFAKKLNLHQDGARKLNMAIRGIIGNSSYRERAKEYAFIYHHRPVPPQKELVHWVEHVVKTRGARHLRSPALQVPWYQKCYLDLTALIVFLFILIVKIFKLTLLSYRRSLKQKLS